MGIFKRACCILYALISLLSVGVLFVIVANPFGVAQSIYNFGIFMPYQWPLITELVLLGIFALVMVVLLGFGLFAPSHKRSVRVQLPSGEVFVERAALEASVATTVQRIPGLTCNDVDVICIKRKEPRIEVEMEVSAHGHMHIPEVASSLQNQVKANLEQLCGVEVTQVTVTFVPLASGAGAVSTSRA